MGQHLKALVVVFLVAVFAVWGFMKIMGPKVENIPSGIASVEEMETNGVPNFKYSSFQGKLGSLDSLQGKIVILNFWASWCAPCIEEVPSLIKLVKEFKGQVHLIAVSGDSNKEDIEVFLKSFPEMQGISTEVVWDEDRSLMKMFQVARLPESLVLDSEHKLVKKLVGSIDWYNKDSIEYMKSLLPKN